MPPVAKNVWWLSAASFLADVSGEMLLAVLPFLLVAQGATGLGVGLVSGISEAVGHALKPLAGRISDRTGKRKPLIFAGYLLAAVSRIGIALATSWPASLLFRSSDRVGKGLRTAPRDALLAESVLPEARGRAFGLHRAADTAGAVVGVGLALGALAIYAASPQSIVLVGAIIGLATAIPLIFVREIPGASVPEKIRAEPASAAFVPFVAVAAIFALGNVSYMFFVLRATGATSETGAVALYLLFNLVYVFAAYPAGRLADRLGKRRLLLAGWVLFAATAVIFIPTPTTPLAIVGFAAMGLAFATFEGNSRALAADLAGHAGRSTRLGWFHASVGLATVAGGVIAGALWDRVGPWSTFAFAAAVSAAAALALLALPHAPRS